MALEELKYERAFRSLGFGVRTIAGAGEVTHLLPGMYRRDLYPDLPPLRYEEVRRAFEGVDLAWVINMASLPFNVDASDMIVRAVTELGIPTIFNHHDLPWEQGFDFEPPRTAGKPWHSVTTNELARKSLARHGYPSHVLLTAFDPDPPPVDGAPLRRELGLSAGDTLLVQPTRFDRQKNVLGGLRVAIDLQRLLPGRRVGYAITGKPSVDCDDEYLKEFDAAAAEGRALGVTIEHGVADCRRESVDLAFSAADLITFPSDWGEGFGLPPIEGALRRKPVAVGRDARVEGVREEVGLSYLPMDAAAIAAWLGQSQSAREAALSANRSAALRRFSFDDFPRRVRDLLVACDLGSLVERAGSRIPPNTVRESTHR